MKYKLKYKREGSLFFKTLVVQGHLYVPEMDRMDAYLISGGVYSIPTWKDKVLILGKDWEDAQKQEAEKEAGRQLQFAAAE